MYTRICPGCGESFQTNHYRKRFCTVKCGAKQARKECQHRDLYDYGHGVQVCADCGKRFGDWRMVG